MPFFCAPCGCTFQLYDVKQKNNNRYNITNIGKDVEKCINMMYNPN